MSETAEKKVIRKVHAVAVELRIESKQIVEFMRERGYDVSRNIMSPVDEEAYREILQKYDRVKLQKYLSETSSTKESEQQRQAQKLRDESKEELRSAKGKSGKEDRKKVELPKIGPVIIEPAPIKAEEKSEATVAERAAEPEAPHPAIEPTAAEEPQSVVAEPAPTTSEVQPTRTTAVEQPPETEAAVEEAVKDTGGAAADVDYAATGRPNKINLPKVGALKIIKEAVPPAPAKDPDKKAAGREAAAAPPAADDQVKKRTKLKRKKQVAKTEPVEPEPIATAAPVEAKRAKQKPGKAPAVVKPDVEGDRVGKRKKKRRGKAEPVVIEEPEFTAKGRKKKKVSEAEVAQTIRQTMARGDGKAKHRRRAASGVAAADVAEVSEMKVTEFVTTQELANLMDVPVQDVIRRCLELGMIVSINQRLEKDMIELLAAEFNQAVSFVQDEELEVDDPEAATENLVKRSPVVTIMGHVDHGKTTLLDYLRKSRIAEKEAGSITQHIGAYEVYYKDECITFLDTPGHEAFTAMRARGAQITDIVILVVAADDRVMPQTLEAIDHARAAGTPIIVAVNKIDKPTANAEAIYKQLSDHNLLVEKWGGKHQAAEISAKFGQGIENLLEEILVAAEVLELRSDPTMRARGVVVESRLDKGLGAVSTVLIQNGTLRIGENFVVGQHYGRVRAMYNDRNESITEAGPAVPAQVVGVNGVPQAGDKFVVFEQEREAREVSLRRQRQQREISMRQIRALSLDQVNRRIKEQSLKELPLIIKGDVHGSVEVLSDALMRLSTDEVKVQIIHRGVGGIVESDVLLAAASGAVVIGFHVHPNLQAKELARREGVEIRLYRIIHEVVDQIRLSLEGLLAPTQDEHVLGTVEVRQVFKISRIGVVAGCYVLEGKITRNSKVRLLRDHVEIYSGSLGTLKRFKDDAREVLTGFECGLTLENFRDIREGDLIQAYEIIQTARKLEAVV